jgi:hypothetical protein
LAFFTFTKDQSWQRKTNLKTQEHSLLSKTFQAKLIQENCNFKKRAFLCLKKKHNTKTKTKQTVQAMLAKEN